MDHNKAKEIFMMSGLQPDQLRQVWQQNVTGQQLDFACFNACMTTIGQMLLPVIQPQDIPVYEQQFNQLQVQGIVPTTAIQQLVGKMLPQEDLARIWSLADFDAAGRITKDKFFLLLHLVSLKTKNQSLVLPVKLSQSLIQSAQVAPMSNMSGVFSQPTTSVGSRFISPQHTGMSSVSRSYVTQGEVDELQNKYNVARDATTEFTNKKSGLQTQVGGLDAQKAELQEKIRQINAQRTAELKAVNDLQSLYLKSQQALEQVKAQLQQEQKEFDQARLKQQEGRKFLQQIDQQVESIKQQIEQIVGEKQGLIEAYTQDHQQCDALAQEYRELQSQLAQMQSEANEFRQQKALSAQKVQQMQAQVQETKSAIQEQKIIQQADQQNQQADKQKDEVNIFDSWDSQSVTSMQSAPHTTQPVAEKAMSFRSVGGGNGSPLKGEGVFRMDSIISQDDDPFVSAAGSQKASTVQSPPTDFESKFPTVDAFDKEFTLPRDPPKQQPKQEPKQEPTQDSVKQSPFGDDFDAEFSKMSTAEAPKQVDKEFDSEFKDFFVQPSQAANPFASQPSGGPGNDFKPAANQDDPFGGFDQPKSTASNPFGSTPAFQQPFDTFDSGSDQVATKSSPAKPADLDDVFGSQPPQYSADNPFGAQEEKPKLTQSESVQNVVLMGFSPEQARQALDACDHDVQKAINLLLDNHQKQSSLDRVDSKSSKGDKKSKRSSKWLSFGKKS